MSDLLIGTDRGVFRLNADGRARREEEPPSAAFFARTHDGRGLDRHYPVPLVAARNRPGTLYTAAAASPPPGWSRGADAALYRSDDGGEHRMLLETGLPRPFAAMVRQIAVDDGDAVSIAAGHEVFVSHDRGDRWRRLAGHLPTVDALSFA